METVKNYIILALAIGCAILFLTRGCGRIDLSNCPEPAQKTRYITVKGEVGKDAPISQPKETYRPMVIMRPVLVATVNEQPIYMQPVDTAAIIKDWATKREYTLDRSDTNITATILAKVQYNRIQDVQLKYEFKQTIHTSLYDRFQFHTIGTIGITSDFEQAFLPQLGAGGLMEFKSGTGAGATYQHTIGATMPHSINLMVTQRISFRKR